MKRAKQVVEMAYDLYRHEVDNPHDPEFHKAIAKGGESVVAYYPCRFENFWGVVNNGIKDAMLKPDSHHSNSNIFLDLRAALDKAVFDMDEQAVVIVLETPLAKPKDVSKSSLAGYLPSGLQKFTLMPKEIPAKHITGVYYPVDNEGRGKEVPIQKFIRRAQAGRIPGISPEEEPPGKGKRRFSSATMDSWQMDALRLVQDMLNYSHGLNHFLLGADQGVFARLFFQATATMTFDEVRNWTGEDWIRLVEKITGETDEGDYQEDNPGETYEPYWKDPHHGFHRPFWQMRRKYTDVDAMEWRGWSPTTVKRLRDAFKGY